MKILYIATSFPTPEKGATIYTDLAQAIYLAGHELTVVVSEEKSNSNLTQIVKERGFDVLRISTGKYYDVSMIKKGITTLRIPTIMKNGISKFLSQREYDFILYESPPVTNADLVIWAKRMFNCPSYLMLKDIFPQNAIDLDIIKKGSLVHRYFQSKEKLLYKSADTIGCMSEANQQYLLKHNPSINRGKTEIFPNTKMIKKEFVLDQFPVRLKYGIPSEACVFLFGGNMGKPQYIELLCSAIVECKDEQNIFFVFVGRGTERYRIEDTITSEKISSALILQNLPRDEYEELTKECDVGLLILDPRFSIPNYPSRILTYMEFSKPVLAATDKVTDINELILNSGCGEWVWSGDKEAFVRAIRSMSTNPTLDVMGKKGRDYLERNLSVNRSIEILEKHFNR